MKKKPCAHCCAKRGLNMVPTEDGEWSVRCSTCWACGPIGQSKAEAVRYWNERVSSLWEQRGAEYREYLRRF